jgi:hypothetical protein
MFKIPDTITGEDIAMILYLLMFYEDKWLSVQV